MIYLDNNATTQLSSLAAASMLNTVDQLQQTPCWEHVLAQTKTTIENGLDAPYGYVMLTSGGTEAASVLLHGLRVPGRPLRVLASPLEHVSVLSHDDVEIEITQIPLTMTGTWDPGVLTKTLQQQSPDAVVLTAVNSEVGIISDVTGISAVVKKVCPTAKVFVDACQLFGKLVPGRVPETVDALSISSHKFHGPSGIGMLWIKDGVELTPLISGGFQQNVYRGGIPNVIGAAGMAAALQEAVDYQGYEKITKLRIMLDDLMLAIPDVSINYGDAALVPNTSNYHIHGVCGAILELVLRKLGVVVAHTSSGLRNTNAGTALMQYLYPDGGADQNIRFSLCRYNTEAEIKEAARICKAAVEALR